MKLIDVLNKVADKTLDDGFEFKFHTINFIYLKELNIIVKKDEKDNKRMLFDNTIGCWLRIDRILNDEIEETNKLEKLVNQLKSDIKKFDAKALMSNRPEVPSYLAGYAKYILESLEGTEEREED